MLTSKARHWTVTLLGRRACGDVHPTRSTRPCQCHKLPWTNQFRPTCVCLRVVRRDSRLGFGCGSYSFLFLLFHVVVAEAKHLATRRSTAHVTVLGRQSECDGGDDVVVVSPEGGGGGPKYEHSTRYPPFRGERNILVFLSFPPVLRRRRGSEILGDPPIDGPRHRIGTTIAMRRQRQPGG